MLYLKAVYTHTPGGAGGAGARARALSPTRGRSLGRAPGARRVAGVQPRDTHILSRAYGYGFSRDAVYRIAYIYTLYSLIAYT